MLVRDSRLIVQFYCSGCCTALELCNRLHRRITSRACWYAYECAPGAWLARGPQCSVSKPCSPERTVKRALQLDASKSLTRRGALIGSLSADAVEERLLRSALQLFEVDDERRIAIENVFDRPLPVAAECTMYRGRSRLQRSLTERVSAGDQIAARVCGRLSPVTHNPARGPRYALRPIGINLRLRPSAFRRSVIDKA